MRTSRGRSLSPAEIRENYPGSTVRGIKGNWPPTTPAGRFAVERTANGMRQIGKLRFATYEHALRAAGICRDAIPDAQVNEVDYQPVTITR